MDSIFKNGIHLIDFEFFLKEYGCEKISKRIVEYV